jgi:type IV secretion system protein TrbF
MSLFKKKAKATGQPVENPYLATRMVWNAHITHLEIQNHLLKIWLIVAGVVVIVAVAGALQIATRSKFVPYVVEVDKLGDALAIDPATRSASAFDPRIVRSTLTSWLTSVRTITPDIAMARRNILTSYAFVKQGDPAKAVLDEWYAGTPGADPISRSRKELVNIETGGILEQTGNTWQVDWTETTRLPDGTRYSRKQYRMTIQVYLAEHPDENESEIRLNPLGIYIKSVHWTELTAQ